MGLPGSGALAFSSIQSQFGGSNPISLNEYYRNGSFVPQNQFNGNVPTSGQISVSQFYSTEGFNSFGQHVKGQSGGKIVSDGWSYIGNATFGSPVKVSVSGPTKIAMVGCSGLNNLTFTCRFMGNQPYNSAGVASRSTNMRTSSANGPVVASFGFNTASATNLSSGTYSWVTGPGHNAGTINNVTFQNVGNGTSIFHNWS
tara:strand:- start:1879 stop:2478 length:600 start_codon:yes stop_codon:yes gene_type:complete